VAALLLPSVPERTELRKEAGGTEGNIEDHAGRLLADEKGGGPTGAARRRQILVGNKGT